MRPWRVSEVEFHLPVSHSHEPAASVKGASTVLLLLLSHLHPALLAAFQAVNAKLGVAMQQPLQWVNAYPAYELIK